MPTASVWTAEEGEYDLDLAREDETDWGPQLSEMDERIRDRLTKAREPLEWDDDEEKEIENELDKFWADHIIHEDQGRARCAFSWCHKLFKSDVFLKKHLLNRHYDYVEAWLTPVRRKYMWTHSSKIPTSHSLL